MPDRDPYLPDGYDMVHRETFKTVNMCALFSESRFHSWPRVENQKEAPTLPAGEAFAAYEALHRPVEHLLWQSIGHRTQRLESDILVKTLVDNRHLKALPLHDALIVPESQAEDAAELLEGAFREVTGGTCRVTIDFA